MAKKNPNYNEGLDLPYKNHYNYQDKITDQERFETVDPVSMTVQESSHSVAEIMQRALGGIPEERVNIEYMDQEDIDKISEFYTVGLDLTDLDRLSENVKDLQIIVDEAKNAKEIAEKETIPELTPEIKTEPTN